MYLPDLINIKKLLKNEFSGGFTLPEILVVILIIGVLAGLIVPNWLAFVEKQKLNAAQDKVYWAIRQAQGKASKEKLSWQVSFREQNGVIQWAVHPAEAGIFISNTVMNNHTLWQSLEPNIVIDKTVKKKDKAANNSVEEASSNPDESETTLRKHTSQEIWRIVFNYRGCPVYNPGDECGSTSLRTLGQITFRSSKGGKARRCVYLSTILGAMRKGKENSKANENDKYCY